MSVMDCYKLKPGTAAIPIYLIQEKTYPTWLRQQSKLTQQWLKATSYQAKADTFCIISNARGHIDKVVLAIADPIDPWCVAILSQALPAGTYVLADTTTFSSEILLHMMLAWGLQQYVFKRYKTNIEERTNPHLVLPKTVDKTLLRALLEAVYLIRDLINTPAEDMQPSDLAEVTQALFKAHGGRVKTIVGEALLTANYPAIYTVGRAGHDAPRLIDARWGDAKHPRITLVGKGVCFDSGGLDLKSSHGMRYMKKDMGGAAHVLGLAHVIMQLNLAVQLRVLIPAVENAVSSESYRPGDIIRTRHGMTVEIGNTDAEGRLILADALYEAAQEKPECVLDFATLTGAARVALGTDLPALFANNDALVKPLLESATQVNDPLWHMPLHHPYRGLLNSTCADINNVGDDAYGGAIIAALFLNAFTPAEIAWAHIDLMAWNLRARPGRPEGGEAMGLRAVVDYLIRRFSQQ